MEPFFGGCYEVSLGMGDSWASRCCKIWKPLEIVEYCKYLSVVVGFAGTSKPPAETLVAWSFQAVLWVGHFTHLLSLESISYVMLTCILCDHNNKYIKYKKKTYIYIYNYIHVSRVVSIDVWMIFPALFPLIPMLPSATPKDSWQKQDATLKRLTVEYELLGDWQRSMAFWSGELDGGMESMVS